MDSLVHATRPVSAPYTQRTRGVGWSAVASGIALLIVGEKPFFPASFSLFILIASLVLLLGMIPIAMWIANSLAARTTNTSAQTARAAEYVGIAGALVAAATALLSLPRWLPAVPAQILETSMFAVIGVWLLIANVQSFGAHLYNRVLAIFGVLAGLCWLLSASIMWIELAIPNLGSAIPTLETLRMVGGYLAQAFYLVWALWLGIWLLVRKR